MRPSDANISFGENAAQCVEEDQKMDTLKFIKIENNAESSRR